MATAIGRSDATQSPSVIFTSVPVCPFAVLSGSEVTENGFEQPGSFYFMKIGKRGVKMLITALVLLCTGALFLAACSPQLGAVIRGDALRRLQQSEHFGDGRFRNTVSTSLGLSEGDAFGTTVDFLRGSPDRAPAETLPTAPLPADSLNRGKGLGVTWLGHSTCLIEIDGRLILTDPMFSERASPFQFIGPRRFPSRLPIKIADLPKLDAVLISHDHYDHLDYRSIRALRDKAESFYVPLGVGGHLRKWGVPQEKIVELDWWERRAEGPLTFVATPARHFSGRGFTGGNRTLWASWVILGSRNRLFFGGDSGYFDGFKTIGDTYGPFDLTMLESGAYNRAWADIHMMPEQTVQAHIDLKGKVLLPIHWGKFNLALHPWTEPIERVLAAAGAHDVDIVAPLQGQRIAPDTKPGVVRWWRGNTGIKATTLPGAERKDAIEGSAVAAGS
jgi:L-ascorbate metabolism protein UlaG (beta-lactamase superfamily)